MPVQFKKTRQFRQLYSIDMLPVSGTGNVRQTVLEAQWGLKDTQRILGGLRLDPRGIVTEMKFALDNALFHVMSCLSFIDKHLRTGGSTSDLAIEVPELENCTTLYLAELAKAKRATAAWAKDMRANEMAVDHAHSLSFGQTTDQPATPRVPGPIVGPAAVGPAPVDIEELKPKTARDSMLLLAGALGVGAIIWMTRRWW